MEQVHVGLRSSLDLRGLRQSADNVVHAFLKARRWCSGNDIDRLHIERYEELAKRDELIGIAEKGDALAKRVLVHVGHHVEKASALVGNGIRNLGAGHYTQGLDEA